jgi:aspartate aminotransferase
MPPSPIRKLAPYADAAKARGIKVYHLNIGQPDVPSPQEFWDGVEGAGLKVLEYSPSQGLPQLRRGMAAHYQSLGIHLEPSQILVTTAGSEALSFAMMACLDPGDEVIVPEPMYANYIGFARGTGVVVKPLTTRIENDFALPSPEEFGRHIGPKTKALLICNPSNPTGTIYTPDQLNGLRELVLQHGLYLIADEVYRTFNYTGQPLVSVMNLEGLEDHAVMVDSVSKRYSLCGARIGFLSTRNPHVFSAAERCAMARLSPPTLDQLGVLACLQTPDSYFTSVREEYLKRRDLLVSRLRAMEGVVCPTIEGAFYATVRIPVKDSDAFAQWLLEEFDLDGATVMVAPASGFYETPGLGKDEIRLAYVLEEGALNQALDCLEAALAAYPGSSR